MEETSTPKHTVFSLIRSRLFAGLLALLPAVLTLWVLVSIVSLADGIAQPAFMWLFGAELPGFGIIATLVALYLVGGLVQNRLLGRFIRYGENLIDRVPLAGAIYSTVRQTVEAFKLGTNQKKFQRVVFVEYPRRGLRAIAFVTRDYYQNGSKRLCLFVPTTPNPTSGVLIVVDESDVEDAKMSVEEAAKFVVSAGLVIKDEDE